MYQSAQGLTTSCEHFLTRHIIVLPMISVAVDSLDAICANCFGTLCTQKLHLKICTSTLITRI